MEIWKLTSDYKAPFEAKCNSCISVWCLASFPQSLLLTSGWARGAVPGGGTVPGISLGSPVQEGQEAGLGHHRVEPGDPGDAGVREGVPGTSPPLRDARIHRSRGQTLSGSKRLCK